MFFYTISFFSKHNFFIDEKHTQWMFRSSHPRCSVRKCVLRNSTKFPGKHLKVDLLKKRPWPQACNFIKKEALVQVFSCEFCAISKNTFFAERIWTTASECWILKWKYFMKLFHVSWNDPETVFYEMPWKKNFTAYPSLKNTFSYRTPPVAASESSLNF